MSHKKENTPFSFSKSIKKYSIMIQFTVDHADLHFKKSCFRFLMALRFIGKHHSKFILHIVLLNFESQPNGNCLPLIKHRLKDKHTVVTPRLSTFWEATNTQHSEFPAVFIFLTKISQNFLIFKLSDTFTGPWREFI